MNPNNMSAGVTCFIDILGFGNKVIDAKTIEEINDIYDKISFVQDSFEFKNNTSLIKDAHNSYGKTVLAFSDSIIINISLQSEATRYSGTFDPIMMELVALAASQALCVSSSIFIRGAIDIGWWYQEESTLISNSLVKAVKRESTANVPVIALCDDLYQYFMEHKERATYHETIDPFNTMFRYYKDEKTSFYFLDYIDIVVSDDDFCPYPESWLFEHARIIEKASEQSPNDTVYKKYVWLASYHNEIVVKYTRNPQCLCTLKKQT